MNTQFYQISLWGLAAGYAIVFPVWLIVWRKRLGVGRDLVVSTLRMSLQLLAVGYVLNWLFGLSLWYLVVAVFLAMVYFAARTVISRTGLVLSGFTWKLFLAILVGVGTVTAFTALFVIRVRPWYEPRWFIPLAGMVIGNSMSGCALALERFFNEVRDRRAVVETRLSLGATAREAAQPMLRSAFRAALIPTLSSMSGMGIVFLPGMMTGQILGGISPLEAIRYQLMIMLAILGAVAFSCFLILILEQRSFFDEYQSLRQDIFG